MRSGELARLAGVTVRALRHYHRVGVLAEPHRRSNGYREYDVHDLVRVLRIRRLASLGIPLERMPRLLDGAGPDDRDEGAGLLGELDAEIAAEIERLRGQRLLIARLRDHGVAPDLPPELAPFLTASPSAVPSSPALERFDREHSILLAHLVGDTGMPQLRRMYERLSTPELLAASAAVSERFSRLGPDSDEDEITAMVEDFMAAFGDVIADITVSAPLPDLSSSAHIFTEYTEDLLNETQRRALAEWERRLSGPPEGDG